MRADHGSTVAVLSARRRFSATGLIVLAALTLAANASGAPGGRYTGEAVVRSLGDQRIVVALDETGSGIATRLFYIETQTPVEELSLRSEGARVESSESGLEVTLPRERRMLRFDLSVARRGSAPRRANRAGTEEREAAASREGAIAPEGFELTRVDRVAALTEYAGRPAGLSLDALEEAEPGAGLQSASSPVLNMSPPTEGGGDGGGDPCPKSCSVTCGDNVSCTASCPSGCAICSCLFGAACHC